MSRYDSTIVEHAGEALSVEARAKGWALHP